ncbi:MAG: hypothetical protein QX198_12645 [Methylococcaceae bacterium]
MKRITEILISHEKSMLEDWLREQLTFYGTDTDTSSGRVAAGQYPGGSATGARGCVYCRVAGT